MNILDDIIAFKKKEIAEKKVRIPVSVLKTAAYYRRSCYSLAASLSKENSTGIIAEFKRRSPSKGAINETAGLEKVITGYAEHGAAGISILTDEHFFGGSLNDLETAAGLMECPLLRKDFMIDEYQIEEAKAAGADVVLLIAAVLTPQRVKELASYTVNLGMEVLLELHAENELEHICEDTVLIGINNRDLQTFEVNIDNSLRLAEKIPAGKIKIAESGIDDAATIIKLRKNGFSGFLIGEYFMKQADPAAAFNTFAGQIKQYP